MKENRISLVFLGILMFVLVVSMSVFIVEGRVTQDVNLKKISPKLQDEFLKARGKPIEVIVNVRDGIGEMPSSFLPMKNVIDFVGEDKVFDGVGNDLLALRITEEEAKNLAQNRYVYSIGRFFRFKIALDDYVDITDAEDAWDYAIDDEETVFATGDGQTIAIADTGIDFTHPDLEDKDIFGGNIDCDQVLPFELCDEDAEVTDENGHGTHVAGIAAANGVVDGIAKDADLISLKITSGAAFGAGATDVNRAIDWTIDNKDEYNISVIVLSVASDETYDEYCDDVPGYIGMGERVNEANDEGITVVVASGNGDPGDDSAISAPACLENVIAVGNVDKDDEIISTSNYDADLMKLFSTGTFVESTCSSEDDLDTDGDGYCVKSGTSFSAPGVAGAAAIIHQVRDFQEEDRLNKTEMEDLLFLTGDPITGAGSENDEFSRINVYTAVLELTSEFLRGDVNGDGVLNIADSITILDYVFLDGELMCLDAADIDDDGKIDIDDVFALNAYMFEQGDEPEAPFSEEGKETNFDRLRCLI